MSSIVFALQMYHTVNKQTQALLRENREFICISIRERYYTISDFVDFTAELQLTEDDKLVPYVVSDKWIPDMLWDLCYTFSDQLTVRDGRSRSTDDSLNVIDVCKKGNMIVLVAEKFSEDDPRNPNI